MASSTRRVGKDGVESWLVYWSLPKALIPDGQKKATGSLTVYSKADEARAKEIAASHKHAILGVDVEAQLIREHEKKVPRKPGTVTLTDWFETWISSLAPGPDISLRQIETYASQFRNFFLIQRPLKDGRPDPDFVPLGERTLDQIDEVDIKRLYTVLTEQGRRQGTIRNYNAALKACLYAATRNARVTGLAFNPATAIKLSAKSADDEDREPEKFFEPEQYSLILQGLKPDARLFARFLCETGLRFSEATALTVEDMAWDTCVVTVDQAHKRTYSGALIERPGKPKGKSDRWAEVTPSVMAEVHRYVERLGLRGKDLIFRAPKGGRIHHSNYVGRRWKPTMHRLTLCRAHMPVEPKGSSACDCLGDLSWTRFGPHALRHTWATWQILAGTPIGFVSRQLGHPDSAFTERQYVHLLKSRPLGVGVTLERWLGREAA